MARNPSLLPTTLWDFPSQNYGKGSQGDINYIGATPSYVIWNFLQRYTRKGDLILDPFCGSGTTLDVAADLERKGAGFDINPVRSDIKKADARSIPLPSNSVQAVFMDPPYGDHIHYSDEEKCIGKLSSMKDDFFQAMEDVLKESRRLIKKKGHLAIYVCDFYKKNEGFSPVGFRLFETASRWFTPLDIISVARHNNDLAKNNYRSAAVRENFFLRGFNYLFIFKG